MKTLHGPPLEGFPGVGDLTMSGFLDEVCRRFASNEALVFESTRWSYADLHREARRVASALIANGVEPDDRVAIVMGNRPEAVAALFGAAMAGAVAVPLSTFATKPELEFMLDHAGAQVVLTQTRLLGRRFMEDIPTAVAAVGAPSWDDFLASGEGAPCRVERSPSDDALITYTSGTTSRPKGILHCHRAPTLQFWVQAQIFRRHEATRLWTALPLFWTAGLNSAMGSTLAAGGCWVMQETFEPGEALALMERERVTEPYTLPHQTAALAEHPSWATTDLSSLKYVYGKSAFARHPTVDGDTTWNMPVGYGLSETCAFFVAHWSDTPRDLLKQSSGRLLPGNQLRVVDGELAIKGPTLMEHYVGMTPEACFDADGFFHTGDAGFFDDDGYVHFTGRRTEMIKTGGANVSPAELEVALRACPPVKLARIVGLPDARLDQMVVACISLKDGAEATEADIQAFLRDRVAPYKVPKRVLFFADGEIPMTSSDTKVCDAELLDLVSVRLGQ